MLPAACLFHHPSLIIQRRATRLAHSPAAEKLSLPAPVRVAKPSYRAASGANVRVSCRTVVWRSAAVDVLDCDRVGERSRDAQLPWLRRAPGRHAQSRALVRRSFRRALEPAGERGCCAGRDAASHAGRGPALARAASVTRARRRKNCRRWTPSRARGAIGSALSLTLPLQAGMKLPRISRAALG